MERKIEIKAQTRTTKEGRTFTIYVTPLPNGDIMEVRFRKAVTNIPFGRFYCVFEDENANIKNGYYGRTLWIKVVSRFEPFTPKNKLSELFE